MGGEKKIVEKEVDRERADEVPLLMLVDARREGIVIVKYRGGKR